MSKKSEVCQRESVFHASSYFRQMLWSIVSSAALLDPSVPTKFDSGLSFGFFRTSTCSCALLVILDAGCMLQFHQQSCLDAGQQRREAARAERQQKQLARPFEAVAQL